MILCVVFLLGIMVIGKKRGLGERLVGFWSRKMWWICLVLSLLGCWAYTYIPAFRLLGTFSSRFLTATSVIRENSITLFGTPDITTDLGYVYLMYDGGLIFTVLFFAAVNKLLKNKKRSGDAFFQWVFACLAVFTILEGYTYSVLSNGVLLYMTEVVYSGKEKDWAKGRLMRSTLDYGLVQEWSM